ncbi:MAG: hypothetical protein JW757_08370 [Anaerolineales bacterium]|nr:hypothetical protein [Anaerolineales bacterium]
MKINKSGNTIIETLSAYLDGQLPEEELRLVRERLAHDASLRAMLDDLRQVRYVLRQTPGLKRRRNFVLSPEMVRKQKTFFRAMNVSRAISAVASVLLVVALGSQYLLSGGMNFAAAPAADMAESANSELTEAVAEEPMMMEAPQELQSMAASTEEDAAAVEEMADQPAEEPAEAALAPEVETEPAADSAEGTVEPSGGGGLPPTPTEEAQQVVGAAASTPTVEGDQRGLPLEKEGDADQVEGEAGTADEDILPPQLTRPGDELLPGSQISTIRILQGVLLLLALAGGLAAAYFRKKVR